MVCPESAGLCCVVFSEHGFNCPSVLCACLAATVCACVCLSVCVSVCVRPPGTTTYKWYKFDDSEVTEWKMDDDEVCCH